MLPFIIIDACSYGNLSDGEYRTVLDNCYFYYKSHFNFTQAAAQCKKTFNGNGRLFEPTTVSSNDVVIGLARSIAEGNQAFWIGVRTQPHDQDKFYYYLSEGPKEPTIEYWSPGEPSKQEGLNCVSVLRNNGHINTYINI